MADATCRECGKHAEARGSDDDRNGRNGNDNGNDDDSANDNDGANDDAGPNTRTRACQLCTTADEHDSTNAHTSPKTECRHRTVNEEGDKADADDIEAHAPAKSCKRGANTSNDTDVQPNRNMPNRNMPNCNVPPARTRSITPPDPHSPTWVAQEDVTTSSRGQARECAALCANHPSQSQTPSRNDRGAASTDVHMASPPKEHIPAYGSSRSTNIWQEANVFSDYAAEKGKIYLYLSEQNPANINIADTKPSFTVTIQDVLEYQTVQDIVKRGARDYSPIRKPAYCLFILDDGDWSTQGRFESIMQCQPTRDDYIEWSKDSNNKNAVRILGTTFDQSNSYLPGFAGRLGSKLSINPLFTDHAKKALKLVKSISGAGNWPINLPKYTEFMVIDIFIRKSAWHDNYAMNFSLVKANFPELVDWLEDENADEDEDIRVWGIAKKDYTFLDLKEFVENGGKLKVKKRRSPSTEEDRSVKGKQHSHKRK
ncbi:hypothetical protein BDZ97DRAFT_1759463 [Flammula alnicola]|nr:hypothetical protein BDZ97DRAFT_1759463 [Flammula alnicola]